MTRIKPLVSVVVATYNRSNLLKETIASILNQTYNNFELIIVDDGSTDDTEDMVSSFQDKRIFYIKIKNSGRPAVPRNVGIKKAKGKYIAFCDDDDFWVEEKLEKQIPYLQKDVNIIGVGSTTKLFGELKLRRQKRITSNQEISFEKAFLFNTCPLSSLVIKNEGFYFNESADFRAVEDFDFQLQILNKSSKCLLMLSDPLVLYRVHPENISETNLLNAINVLDKYKDSIPKALYDEAKARAYLIAGFKSVRQGGKEFPEVYNINTIKLSHNITVRLKFFFLFLLVKSPKYVKAVLFKLYYSLFKIR